MLFWAHDIPGNAALLGMSAADFARSLNVTSDEAQRLVSLLDRSV